MISKIKIKAIRKRGMHPKIIQVTDLFYLKLGEAN
jgi:hypothetical protein